MIRRLLLLLFSIWIAGCVGAQSRDSLQPEAPEDLLQNIELLMEQQQQEEADYSPLLEARSHYRRHPLSLNAANQEELQSLQLLSDIQINALLQHLDRYGDLISIYELQSIPYFDLAAIRQLLPYVYVSLDFHQAHFSFREMLRFGKHEFTSRFQRIVEPQKGYHVADSIKALKPNGYYLGDANRVLSRYKFNYNSFVALSICGEKDAGESFQKGFDFYSGHLTLRKRRFFKTLILGDFQAAYGQGLTLWNGFGFGKSASTGSVKRVGYGLRPYQSFDELHFFRGIGVCLAWRDFELSLLGSRRRLDANLLTEDSLFWQGQFQNTIASGLASSGLHNTQNTLANKGNLVQNVLGGNLAYTKRNLHLGLSGSYLRFDMPLVKELKPYNQFDFRGQEQAQAGIDYNYVIRNINFFGETAINRDMALAMVHGLLLAADPRLTLTVLYRRYDRNYNNLLANGIAENTYPQNEEGLYFGAELRLPRSLTLSGYADLYHFPWLKYQVSAPSQGRDFFMHLSYRPSKTVEMYLRYRNRQGEEDSETDNLYKYPVAVTRNNLRYVVSLSLLPALKLRSRIDYVKVEEAQQAPEEGLGLAQDIIYKAMGTPFSFSFRYALFDTKSYASRIYMPENDVLYSSAAPMLYDQGQRIYGMINWDITRRLELWLRIARTIYTNQQRLYAGTLNEIDANHLSEIKLQCRIRF